MLLVRLQDCHLLWSPFPERSSLIRMIVGLIRVRSPLLTESRLISFPVGTEMFQFSTFALSGLYIQPEVPPSTCVVEAGCPIRKSPDRSLFGGSPELIAAYNVLHRLRTPRHPPYSLSSLTTFMNCCGSNQKLLERELLVHRTVNAANPNLDQPSPTFAENSQRRSKSAPQTEPIDSTQKFKSRFDT